jgi:hypothetical protein
MSSFLTIFLSLRSHASLGASSLVAVLVACSELSMWSTCCLSLSFSFMKDELIDVKRILSKNEDRQYGQYQDAHESTERTTLLYDLLVMYLAAIVVLVLLSLDVSIVHPSLTMRKSCLRRGARLR